MTKKRPRTLPDPEDVLAGRVRASADELFALVHDVNPTGEESPRERERYALKSRLQGLLLTRFGDEVEVVPDPANPDLVGLRHRSGLRDACHAVVSQLPVEARALVRRRLDAGDGGPEGTAAGAAGSRPEPPGLVSTRRLPADGDDAAALEARGLAALEAWDYEEAQRLLTDAVGRGAGPAAARALLELLVDVLADDAAALELEEALGAARNDPAVRGLLALAAARAGDGDRAARLVRGLDGGLAARVHAALARAGLDAGDLDRASRHLSAAREADPASPEVAELAARLERARRGERLPAEEALLALHAAGDRDGAEASAHALLARWPDSTVARRLLRELAEARRSEQAAAHERARRAAAEDAGKAGEAEARRVAEALNARPAPEALAAFAGLAPQLRGRVRAASSDPRLALVEEVLASAHGERPRAVAEAALAVAAATEALRGGQADTALRHLEPHARVLARLPRAAGIEKEASAALAEERAALARAALEPVREALDRDDLDGAAALLGQVRKPDLGPGGRAVLSSLAERLDEARRIRQALHDAASRAAAREALRLAVSEEPGPADELASVNREFDWAHASPWLSPDGRRLVVAESVCGWLFVRVLDVERQQVVRRISLRPPHPIGSFEELLVEKGRVRIVGDELGLVDLDLGTNEVVHALSLAGALPRSAIVEETLPLPSSDLVWLEVTGAATREARSVLVDTRSGRIRTKLPFDPSPSVVFREGSSILVTCVGLDARLLTLDGLPAAGALPALPFHLWSATPDPTGPGLLVAGQLETVPAGDEALPTPIRVVEVRPGTVTTLGRSADLPGTAGEFAVGLATSRSEALAFALCSHRSASRVHTIGPGLDLSIEPVKTPEETVLLVDAGSNHAVAACWWGERFAAVPLTRTTRWPAWKGSLRNRNPLPRENVLGESYLCEDPSRTAGTGTDVGALHTTLSRLAGPRLEERVAGLMARARTGDRHVVLLGALERMGPRHELRQRVEADLLARFPDHPLAVLTSLRRHAGAARWDLLRDEACALRKRGPRPLFAHVLHLEAIARARLGELDEAFRLVEEIRDRKDGPSCDVGALGTVLKACLAKDRSTSPLGRLVDAVRRAIGALAAGEPQAVVTLLDRASVRASRVHQAQALLAAAWLGMAADTPRALFRRRLALARLLELQGKEPLERRDLPRLPGALDDAEIESIAARARQLLEGTAGSDGAPSPA